MIDKGLKDLFKNKYFYLGLGLLIFAALLNQFSSKYILTHVSNLPVLSDLILDRLPYYRAAVLYDIFSLLAIGIFLIFVFNMKKYKNVPYYLILFGILYIIRGIFIVLTPLGNPTAEDKDIFHTLFKMVDAGVYPSGHTGSAFLAFLLAGGIYRPLIFICLVGVIVTLFLGKGHYSIDILSALIFAYAVYCFGKQFIKVGQDEK